MTAEKPESEIEEAREIIKVRRISSKPANAAEPPKNDEAEAAKARQAELEKRLRRLQVFLGSAILIFLLLGLRALGCFSTARSRPSPPSVAPSASVPSASVPSAFSSASLPEIDVASTESRRLFSQPPTFGEEEANANSSPSASNASASSPSLNDLRVVRIATWNLEPFDFSKVTNLSVGRKIARVLQEFDVVAVQGVRSQNRAVLEAILYLIAQQGKEYDYIAPASATGGHYSATFFNTQTIIVDRESISDVYDVRGRLQTPALVANFRPNAVSPESCFTFQIINIHLAGDATDGDALSDLLATLKKRAGGFGLTEDDLIVAGDFGNNIQKIKNIDKISNAATLHSDSATDVDGGSDANLLFDSVATVEYVERFGVVDLAEYFDIADAEVKNIANGRPVWGDFSVYEGGDPNFFAPQERKTSFTR
ncbi:MAG: hypothetical protein IJ387_12535 [Thermoguttaceae bacterium]|nr:hypothetical protein [Thermoguttaceae bacterium]